MMPCLHTLGPLNIGALEVFLGFASPCLMDQLNQKIWLKPYGMWTTAMLDEVWEEKPDFDKYAKAAAVVPCGLLCACAD
jgi:hypothetical protein